MLNCTKITITSCFALLLKTMVVFSQHKLEMPWQNGNLKISLNGRYLQHQNGIPFFWLGETGWLLPQKTDREEAYFYLNTCAKNNFNVVQIQVINNVPAYNKYGQPSMLDSFNLSCASQKENYGYWNHLDYIIKTAEQQGTYIGMVCIWGGLVKAGLMNSSEAKTYGSFLAERYKNTPNIIWIIGGDIKGDIKKEVWETLATTIKEIDTNHLMTFHPFGRTSSANWFNDAKWLDFNMFQSGHRRYDQQKGDGDFGSLGETSEDNWRYVEKAWTLQPPKPIIDGEPSYEDIPQGLHDTSQPRWHACDVRRYAYWSVFAGAFGHTYGNNSLMQFYRLGTIGAYGANRPWYDCLKDPGFIQMKFLKQLLLRFPFCERVPDQSIIVSANGLKYQHLIATRGTDFLLVYDYAGLPFTITLSKISGAKKKCWWYNPQNGNYIYIGEFKGNLSTTFKPRIRNKTESDWVLIAFDASKEYIH